MSRRRRRIACHPNFLLWGLFSGVEHEIHVRLTDGVPEDAEIVAVVREDDGTIVFDFEHDSFPELAEGEDPRLSAIQYDTLACSPQRQG